MENIKEILDQLNEVALPVLPAKVVKISYDPEFHYGQFICPPPRDVDDKPELIGKVLTFIPVKEYGRYVRFNEKLNKSDIVSNLFNPFKSKEAIDKFSKKLISDLKQKTENIKYKLYLFGYIVKGNNVERGLFVLSGATLKSFISIQSQLNKIKFWRAGSLLTLKPVRERNGGVNFFSLDITVQPLPDETVALIAKDLPAFIQDIEVYVETVNSFMKDDELPVRPLEDKVMPDDAVDF